MPKRPASSHDPAMLAAYHEVGYDVIESLGHEVWLGISPEGSRFAPLTPAMLLIRAALVKSTDELRATGVK